MDSCWFHNEKQNFMSGISSPFPFRKKWTKNGKQEIKYIKKRRDRRGQMKWRCTKTMQKAEGWGEEREEMKRNYIVKISFHHTQCRRKVSSVRRTTFRLHGVPLSLYSLLFSSFFAPPSLSYPLSSQKQSDSHLFHIRPTLWLQPLCIHAGWSA